MRTKRISLLVALVFLIGAMTLPMTAFAAGGKDTTPPTLTAVLDGETVKIVSSDDNSGVEAVYIDKVESFASSIRMVSRVGSRIPLYCSGVGKALLADLTDQEIGEIWKNSRIRKLTPRTITELPVLMERVEQVRKDGYAVDDEENEEGVRCIAASLRDYHKDPVYALSISAPANRMTDQRILELKEYVLAFRQDLSRSLGLAGK